jgi:hypothetical protein
VSVRETLELDIADALSSIEEVGNRLTNVAQAFGEVLAESMEAALSGLPIIQPAVDVESISDEVEQALTEATSVEQVVEVAVDADASAITEAGDEAAAAIDTEVELTVSVDSTGVDEFNQQVEQTSKGADEATESVDNMGGAAGFLGAKLGAAKAGLMGLSTGAAAAAAGAAGAAVGVKFLYDAAFESVAVTQTWENTLGTLGARIEDLGSGTTGFSQSLRQLAQDTGSSDEAVLIATLRYTQFQQAAGLADDEIVKNTQNIAALAAQVRINNPQLGTMDEIIRTLSRSLGRGGPRLQQYGIDINTAAIEVRALEMTGKAAAEELTGAEKSAAGLSIAMEQVAPNAQRVADGMSNVQVASDRAREKFGDALEVLGEPLVEPVTEALVDLAEAFEGLANVIASAIPYVSGFLSEARKLGDWVNDNLDPISKFLALEAPDGQSWLEFGEQVRGGGEQTQETIAATTVSLTDFGSAVSGAVGTAAQIIDGVVFSISGLGQESAFAAQAMATLAEAGATSLPTVLSLFQDITAETTPDQLKANLDEQIALTQQWVVTMYDTQAAGFGNVTTLLAQLGPERSAMLVGMYGTQLADLEKHLAEVYAAEQRARVAVNELAVREFLRLRGITGAEADAIVGVFAANLQLGVPAAEELNAVIRHAETKKLAAFTAFGDFAGAANKSVQDIINENTGRAIADNLDKGLGDGLSKEQAQAIWQAAIYAQRVKNKINEILGVKSPSTEMMKTGYELARGLAMGIEGNTGLVDTAIGSLGQSALGLTVSAGLPGARGTAPINISVPITVAGGMTAEDGARIGEAAGAAAADQLRRRMRLEALVA